MTIVKKACEVYRKLGSNTRLIIRITIILFYTLLFTAVYTLTATHSKIHYELLLLTDPLIECAKSVCGIGFLGIVVSGIAEGKQNNQSS